MDLKLYPCERCRKQRVLKPGDYCLSCAQMWDADPELEYIVLDTDTIDDAAEISGLAREYLKAKHTEAWENNQFYVIYFARDEWHEITISDRFHIPTVMKNLMAKFIS